MGCSVETSVRRQGWKWEEREGLLSQERMRKARPRGVVVVGRGRAGPGVEAEWISGNVGCEV